MAFTYVVCTQCLAVNRVQLEKGEKASPRCGRCSTVFTIHDGVQELNPDGFQQLIEKSPLPVVVDFWAPWCGPCRAFAPTYVKTAKKLAGKIVLAKLNTQNFPEISTRLSIRGIPTLAVFHRKKELGRKSGAMDQSMLESWLSTYIKS
jgi:thioredoxin 2